ncbi:MAG: trans-aconitate 2-methyltransferase [Anaerolineae bacterium]
MKQDASNTWLTGTAQANTYVSSADVIIVERQRTIKLLADIFRYHFGEQTGLRVLDLGGGDGVITEYLHERYQDNAFTLLDGSADMLEKARRRLEGRDTIFIQQTFEEYLDAPPEDQKYDFIFSSNAIHHLDFLDKSRLYAKLFRELAFGGAFINIDVVKATSERSERWQFAMWEDWMDERLTQIGGEAGQYDGLPQAAKAKPENKPSGLFEQLEMLRRVGFRDVDCFYKYGVFVLFGGTK